MPPDEVPDNRRAPWFCQEAEFTRDELREGLGAAANLAEHCIKKVEGQEYRELGMEAIGRIEVVDFPAFIIIDGNGNDFFKELKLG